MSIYNVTIKQTQTLTYRVRADDAPDAESIALTMAEHDNSGAWDCETTSSLSGNQAKPADND